MVLLVSKVLGWVSKLVVLAVALIDFRYSDDPDDSILDRSDLLIAKVEMALKGTLMNIFSGRSAAIHAVVDYDEVMNAEMSVGITALMLAVVKPPHAFHLVVC